MVKENKFFFLPLFLWLFGPFSVHSLSFLLIGVRGKLCSLVKRSEKKQPVEKNIWIKENGINRRSSIELQSETIRKNGV